MKSLTSTKNFRPSNLDKIQYQTHVFQNFKDISGIDLILICSTDGFLVTTVKFESSEIDSDKVCAISSSIYALFAALTREVKFENCNQVILQANNGKLLIQGCRWDGFELNLIIIMNNEATLGQVKFVADKIAQITKIISSTV